MNFSAWFQDYKSIHFVYEVPVFLYDKMYDSSYWVNPANQFSGYCTYSSHSDQQLAPDFIQEAFESAKIISSHHCWAREKYLDFLLLNVWQRQKKIGPFGFRRLLYAFCNLIIAGLTGLFCNWFLSLLSPSSHAQGIIVDLTSERTEFAKFWGPTLQFAVCVTSLCFILRTRILYLDV